MKRDGILTPISVYAESIPEAHYKAIEAVWTLGDEKRTQYDRKDKEGNYIEVILSVICNASIYTIASYNNNI